MPMLSRFDVTVAKKLLMQQVARQKAPLFVKSACEMDIARSTGGTCDILALWIARYWPLSDVW